MADKKIKTPAEGPHGVDRWTSNGYGITIDGKKVEPLEEKKDSKAETEIDEIEEVE